MRRSLPFQQTIIFMTLFVLCNGQTQTCSVNNRILQCEATSSSSTININSAQANECDSIKIKYSGNVVLDLTSPSTKPIIIERIDSNDHKLRISNINTGANRIQIKIHLSSGQIADSLFTDSSSIIAEDATITVEVIQNNQDASNFKIFGPASTTTMNFANFELNVNATTSTPGNLNLPYLIRGLTNVKSISISGSNHDLTVDSAQMPSSNNINELSLKQLHLHNQILFNFRNLSFYSIEQCTFNKSSLFLNSTPSVYVILEMKNNNPTDSVLPFGSQAFLSLGLLKSLTLIEPKLNSTVLKAIKQRLYPLKIIISLNDYQINDMKEFAAEKLTMEFLTIKNIPTLNVFPDVFFSNFHPLRQVTLQGTFLVEKSIIRLLVGINKEGRSQYPIVQLDTTDTTWDKCAEIYIESINIASISDIKCLGDPTCQACQHWYDETMKCDLISYEKNYTSLINEKPTNNHFYYNSTLYYFFQNSSCINTQSTTPPPPKKESVNIGAIIGALCGLIVAAIILGITIYCVCRNRNRYESTYEPSAPHIKKIRSSSDPSNVSIATSKTSKSSRYALEKSFFPTIQPNDEIAPPLYTAPSESVVSTSNYQSPSAPPTHRDSISTHTTHVYETLDP